MLSPAGLRRLLALSAALACALPAAAPAQAAQRPTALIALLPVDLTPAPPGVQHPNVSDLIDGHPELALGMLSATQCGYSPQQALLDTTSGTRTSRGTYSPHEPPEMSLMEIPPADPLRPHVAPTGLIVNWLAAVARAESAPADIVPGLLASSIPGGGGYAGIVEETNQEA